MGEESDSGSETDSSDDVIGGIGIDNDGREIGGDSPPSPSSLSEESSALNRDHWLYVFGGSVACIAVETRASQKLKGRDTRGKSLVGGGGKKIYPFQIMVREGEDEEGGEKRGSSAQSSWITLAASSKEDCQKWVSRLRLSLFSLTYLRSCRDCSYASPLHAVLKACSVNKWREICIERQLVTNKSACALAVFLKRVAAESNEESEMISAGGGGGRARPSPVIRCESLVLEDCGFTDVSCGALRAILESLPGLQRLKIPRNRITDEGIMRIESSAIIGGKLLEVSNATCEIRERRK